MAGSPTSIEIRDLNPAAIPTLEDPHSLIVCFAHRHDKVALTRQLKAAALNKLPDIHLRVPIIQGPSGSGFEVIMGDILCTLRANRYYEMALVVTKIGNSAIVEESYMDFGVYAPGMSRLDIHEVLSDYVRDMTPDKDSLECVSNHTRMGALELQTLVNLKTIRPDPYRLMLVANGGYCFYCMKKQLEIIEAVKAQAGGRGAKGWSYHTKSTAANLKVPTGSQVPSPPASGQRSRQKSKPNKPPPLSKSIEISDPNLIAALVDEMQTVTPGIMTGETPMQAVMRVYDEVIAARKRSLMQPKDPTQPPY